ncbi:MAG: DEAD/DEAH box helicase, partial [Ethanoligenens sp.]
MQFSQLQLDPNILKALVAAGYEQPTPIQEQSIPYILESRDLLGTAQTGTGKTAAFAVPILDQLCQNHDHPVVPRHIRALVLSPTRELAIQIKESFDLYGRFLHLRNTVIFGGVSQIPQVSKLREGVDILIATPGRLLDLMNQRHVDLSHVSYFVLDEADRMLDMGFINDVHKVVEKLPQNRQTLLFSATMPPDIKRLADKLLKDPARVAVAPVSSTAETVEQKLFFLDKKNKQHLLVHLLKTADMESVLVFSRTKHGANKIVEHLEKAGIP